MPSGSGCAKLAALGEEGLEEKGAIFGEDAGRDFDLMVEAGVGQDFEAGADGAALGVVGAVDEAWHAGLNHGAGAHAARLNGDVERDAGEAIIAEEACGFAKDDNFRVGGGVAVADGTVAGASEDLAVVDKNSADGDFASGGRGASFEERFLHELGVSFHRKTENNMWKGGSEGASR
jgi:hypothetical protein